MGLLYLAVASEGTFRFRRSAYPHHVLVADAWLHGQMNVREEVIDAMDAPFFAWQRRQLERERGRRLAASEWRQLKPRLRSPGRHDWSYVGGRYYGYWGPMPAVLMLPLVAARGIEASDRLVSCLIGAGTVFLMFLVVREANRHGFVPATTALAATLTILFGLGTVHFYMSVLGQVWFFTQVVATFFFTLAVWCILRCDRGWVWAAAAGAALAASFLSRNLVVVMSPFFLCAMLAVARGGDGDRTSAGVFPWASWKRTAPLALAFAAALALGGLGQLAFNYARFGNVLEDGLAMQLTSGANPLFSEQYLRHGGLSLWYVPQNIYYYFLNPMLTRLDDGTWSFDPFGNSMFLVSPALLYVFLSGRRRGPFTVGLWIGTAACMTLLLLFLGSGWYNFGNRYLLDLMPLAILLVGIGMGGRVTRVGALLVALSIAVNAWGTYRFVSLQF